MPGSDRFSSGRIAMKTTSATPAIAGMKRRMPRPAVVRAGHAFLPRSPAGPHQQHDGEQDHDDEVAGAAQVEVRELLQHGDEHRGDRGTRERAEAADDRHDEREDEQRRAEVRRDERGVVHREHSPDAGRGAADREDERERAADVDAERGDHRAVLDAGADDHAVARLLQEAARARAARARPRPSAPSRCSGCARRARRSSG